MASGDVVRLVNVGDADFVDGFNGRTFTIKAHSQLMVDFDAMCLWLGHPEANDFDPRNRVRVAEYERLRCKYGVDARALELTLNKVAFDHDQLFEAMRPPLEAYGMDDQRILTVADDPTGEFLTPTVSAQQGGDNLALLMARMQSNEQEMANLRQQLAQAQRREQALNDAQPIDEDAREPVNQNQGIPGTVIESGEPRSAPRDPAVSETGEDAPTRIRVTQT
jgi:hypothetical protein